MAQQHGLGRGLASLIPPKKTPSPADSTLPVAGAAVSFSAPSEKDESDRVLQIPVGEIVPNPYQPRLHFSEEKLAELAESIREHGILQPLIVTKNGPHRYELIAGERRFQSAKLVGLKTVPAIVREAENKEKFELAIIENIQRHDLNPIEEAKAYRKLMDEFGLSQEAVAKKMGKSRSAVANISRLLQLPIEIQRALSEGKISEGHAKALLALDNPEKQRALFEMIVSKGMTVREAEAKAREVSVRSYKRSVETDPVVKEKEHILTETFGTKVKISKSGNGGKIVIEYYGEEDLVHLQHQAGEQLMLRELLGTARMRIQW